MKNMVIVDTLLWAYHAVEQYEVLTFDENLQKHIKQTDMQK